jgi:hypothetical protein
MTVKISELVAVLNEAQAEHGDVEVYVNSGGCGLGCGDLEQAGRVGLAAGRWGGSWGGRAPLVIEASAGD